MGRGQGSPSPSLQTIPMPLHSLSSFFSSSPHPLSHSPISFSFQSVSRRAIIHLGALQYPTRWGVPPESKWPSLCFCPQQRTWPPRPCRVPAQGLVLPFPFHPPIWSASGSNHASLSLGLRDPEGVPLALASLLQFPSQSPTSSLTLISR